MTPITLPEPTTTLYFEAWFEADNLLVSLTKVLPGHVPHGPHVEYLSGFGELINYSDGPASMVNFEFSSNQLHIFLTPHDLIIRDAKGTAPYFMAAMTEAGWTRDFAGKENLSCSIR